MALLINTNLASNNISAATSGIQDVSKRLASVSESLRISAKSSKDNDNDSVDIANRYAAQIRGRNESLSNLNDGISLSQTATAGLSDAQSTLQRIRDLAVQAANGANSNSDRTALQNQATSLTSELDNLAANAQFNGKSIFDGSESKVTFQIGASANQTLSLNLTSVASSQLGNNALTTSNAAGSISQATAGETNNVQAQTLSITGAGSTQQVNVAAGQSAADIAANVNQLQGQTGVYARASTTATISGVKAGMAQFTLQSSDSQAVTISANVNSDNDVSSLVDAINMHAGATGITASIDSQTGGLALYQGGGQDIKIGNLTTGSGLDGAIVRGGQSDGSTGPGVAIGAGTAAAARQVTVGGQIDFMSSSKYSIATNGDTSLMASANNDSQLQSVANIDLSTTEGAMNALSTIDSALNSVGRGLAQAGSFQNRLSASFSSLENSSINMDAARSRIQDADFASETAMLSRNQVLQQAGTAMLSQANSLPQGVLSLLRG